MIIDFFYISEYLSTFESDRNIPLSEIPEGGYDPDDEDGVDYRSDPRIDFFDRAEIIKDMDISPSTHIKADSEPDPASDTSETTENQ